MTWSSLGREAVRLVVNTRSSRVVRLDDIKNGGAANGTVAAALALPLLEGALVTHAHVAAHVQHAVDGLLVADSALVANGTQRAWTRKEEEKRGSD